jgi:hypothetical protein
VEGFKKDQACIGCQPSDCVVTPTHCYKVINAECKPDAVQNCGCPPGEDNQEITTHGERASCSGD